MITRLRQFITPLRVLGVLVVMAATNIWQVEIQHALTPMEGRPPTLWGILIVAGLLTSFGAVAWWLFLSPINPTQRTQAELSDAARRQRRWVGLGMIVASLSFITGGMVDMLWHYWLGGFGDDFLWTPHLLIYLGFLINMLIAGSVLGRILAARGNRRARARQEAALGVAALTNAYIIFSLPSDALWHQIYGIDITPWSLPHMLIAIMGMTSVLAAIFLLVTSLKPGQFDRLVVFGVHFLVGVFTWGPMLLLMPEYELNSDTASSAIITRPGWVYPLAVFLLGYIGTVVIFSLTKRFGSAIFVGFLAVLGRIAFAIAATTLPIDYQNFKFSSHLAVLAAALVFEGLVLALSANKRFGLNNALTPRQWALRMGVLYWFTAWPVCLIITALMRVGSPLQLSDIIIGPLLGLLFIVFYGVSISVAVQRFHLETSPAQALSVAVSPGK